MTDLITLTDLPSPTTDDIIYVVDDPAGAKNPRKCSIANLHAVNDARTKTFTNTTYDADGSGNSITNIENADIKAGAGIDATKIADGTVTSTEFQYINTLSSNAQTQLTGKVDSGGALGTPSSGTLTSCTGLPIAGLVASTSTAIGVGSIELGHASDTTLSRVSA